MIAGAHVVMWVAYDPPGNDACRFHLNGRRMLIEGSSRTEGMATRYRVRADEKSGITLRTRINSRLYNHLIERDAMGRWTLNGKDVPEVEGLVDIHLGFTPATNTLPIRRLGLAIGKTAEVVAAWFDPVDHSLKPLRQTYRRTAADRYHYAVPDHGFETELTVDGFGAVTNYPGYWDAVA